MQVVVAIEYESMFLVVGVLEVWGKDFVRRKFVLSIFTRFFTRFCPGTLTVG